MRMKRVLVEFNSKWYDGSDNNSYELIAEGTYRKTDDGYVIGYKEQDLSEGIDTRVTVTAMDEYCVIVSKTSKLGTSDLILEMGHTHQCRYGTPMGALTVFVTAKEISSALDDNGGELCFKYHLDVNGVLLGDFEVSIKIKPDAKAKLKTTSNMKGIVK